MKHSLTINKKTMKIRDKQRWLSNQMSWLTRNINLIFTLVLLFSILPNCSHGFKYIALASTTSKVNATPPEIQFHVNNVTLTDNTISDNDSEEGHAKVVKTISSLLAESLNKSIGHFQYIQENRDSTSSERQLRLSLTTTTSTLTGPDEGSANNHKEPCTESRRSDDTLEDDGNSDESKSVILGNSASGLNDSIISVTLTSKTASDGLQDDKTGPTTINPSDLVTRVTGSSILTDKLATVYYGDQDEDDTSNDSGDIQKMNNGDGMNLRKYFKPITTTLPPDPSPVYQPEEAVKVVPIGQNNRNQNVNERKDKNNGTQFICIKVINGKLTYPSMAKLVYPQLKETSLVMPTVPKIPLSFLSFKKYVNTYNDSSTESIFNGTNDSVIELNEGTKSAKQPNSFGVSGRQPKHYVQRYYPVDLYSLDSIQKKNVSYTLKSSLSFDPGDNETHYLNNRRRSSVTANNDATTETTTNITTTTPTVDPLVSEKSTDLNTFSRLDSDKIKYKPITYKTTVIIPKITTTTVSLSTNYPKSSSAESMTITTTTPLPSSTEMSSIHSSNKIIHEFGDKKDSKYDTNKKKHDKESVKSNKKSDKSTKKDIQMMNSGSSISSQRLVSSRLRFPDSSSANIKPKSTPIDTSFDSFEIPSEEPIIIPNSMIRSPFGLTTILPNGLQHQVSASNPSVFQSHHHYNNVNLHQKKYQQLSTPITVNQHSMIPEVLQSSTILPNELTDNPLVSLMSPSIGSSYRGLASKLKSAINFSPKQQQYPNQQSHYQNSYSFVPSSNQMNFGYNGYDQSGLESVYKLNPHSTTNDMVYYDPRLNYKPEVSLMTPYLPNLQGSYVRQPASKFLRQYQALVTSASSMVQRNPSQSIQYNHNPSQLARQPSQLQHNRQQLIPPTNFYPVFQPIQSLSLNSQTFQDPHEIHQHSNYYHQQQHLRPKVSTSMHHKLKPEHINLLEQGDSSSITSVSRASVAASGSKLSSSSPSFEASTTDDKQSSKSSRKNRSKTGSIRSRNSRTKSKRKNKQNNLSGNSSLPSKAPKSSSTSTSLSIETFQKSSPKTLSNPCSSSDSTNCQSLGGLLFNPSRSVKFELRDALS